MGPYYWETLYLPHNACNIYSFLYSDNSSGNDDIKGLVYVWYNPGSNPGVKDSVHVISGIEKINTDFNEAYPSIREDELYFTSDRSGDYDIYMTFILEENVLYEKYMRLTDNVFKVQSLSGPDNDKCPFVYGNTLVFTSDRGSGYGGFDLYYSVFDKNGWSEPKNFGENINTEYDEYRPIIIAGEELGNDLMIFSSNRPGGVGGFDLYYVGVPKQK